MLNGVGLAVEGAAGVAGGKADGSAGSGAGGGSEGGPGGRDSGAGSCVYSNISRREPYVPLNCNGILGGNVDAVGVGAVFVVANPASLDSPGVQL